MAGYAFNYDKKIKALALKITVRTRLISGQVSDSETGLYQNWHRDYDSSVGRYIESDPIGLRGGINTYAYVGANPLSYVDPLGLRSSPCPASWGLPAGAMCTFGDQPGEDSNWNTGDNSVYPPKHSDGNGPAGLVCGPASNPKLASWIPDGSYTKACQKHDDCYATCGKSKAQCDADLLVETGSALYFTAVSLAAQAAYDEAQKKCKDECKK